MDDVPKTFGALLLGGLVAGALTGVVSVQSALYFKLYPTDRRRLKLLVLGIWIVDLFHTGLVWASLWTYLITHYGQAAVVDEIPWMVASTIALTAAVTFVIHCFFALRIYRLSKNKWYIAGPIVVLALLRLSAACTTTAEMVRLKQFSLFTRDFAWVFTLGLATSSTVDVLIAIFLCYFLRVNRSDSTSHSLRHVLNLLVLYALETGALTCAGSIVSMICWLVMPHNRIFLGLHFVISKLYANSLLATLNARKQLRRGRSMSEEHSEPELSPAGFKNRGYRAGSLQFELVSTNLGGFHATPGTRLEINVEKTVQSQIDEDMSDLSTTKI